MSISTPSSSENGLPFSVLSENRTIPFTSKMEMAAVFALAEIDRDKGGGLLSRRPQENIAFVTKIGYPIWLIPLFEKPVLFDGLNRFKHSVLYAQIPDVKLFINNLKRTATTCETHLAFLSDHLNYFETQIEETEIVIKGLISDSDFLNDFSIYLMNRKGSENLSNDIGVLPQIIEKTEISSGLEKLKSIYDYVKENKDRLIRSMKLIKKINGQHIEYLESIIGETKHKFKEMIKKEEDIVNPQIIQLKKEYDYLIVKTTKSFQRQELPIYKEKIKLEKLIKLDETKIDNCKIQAQKCAEKDDKISEQKWKERRKRTKKIVSENSKKLDKIEDQIEILNERKTLAIFQLKSEVENKITNLQKRLHDLETSREAKLMGYNQEVENLKRNCNTIIDQLGRFIKIEDTDLSEFSDLVIKENPEIKKSTLYHIPFYVICYQVDSKKRYKIIPPSIVNTVCLTTKLKSLGRSQIKQIFSDRFYSISALISELEVLLEQNHLFLTELQEIGKEFNILKDSVGVEYIKKGLADLKSEGWFSEKEYEKLIP